MRNIKIVIEYDGTNYCGWQIQRTKKKSIQQVLEKTLSQILQHKLKVIGSGRTDAGVHAQGQVANFKTLSKISCPQIQKALNSILPEDIRIKEVTNVHPNFHARFLAKAKLYRYLIVNDSFTPPHLRAFVYLVKPTLNLKKMRQAAKYLLGRHNFRSFQAVDKKERVAIRTIKRLDITKHKKLISCDIQANGFLYKMARNIVGSLIEVGKGRFKPQDINKILKAKNRKVAGPCAPAKGLCLLKVQY